MNPNYIYRSSIGINSIAENKVKTALFPNPANSFVTIRTSTSIDEIEIYNESGMLLKKLTGNNAILMDINIEKLANGIYFCKVFRHKEYEVLKLIVKR
jgi:hypothetical protein